jgi:hypothetical protein
VTDDCWFLEATAASRKGVSVAVRVDKALAPTIRHAKSIRRALGLWPCNLLKPGQTTVMALPIWGGIRVYVTQLGEKPIFDITAKLPRHLS